MVLLRTNPFENPDGVARRAREIDGSTAHPSTMPMDARREDDVFVVEFDLPGVDPSTIDLDVERHVVTVQAERPARPVDVEFLAAERPRGTFSRQLMLGENLDTGRITARYEAGVLILRIPVAARSDARKIPISSLDEERQGS